MLRVPCFLSRKSGQRYFVNGTTQSRSFLTKRKTRPYLFTENFSELSAQMVSALNDLRTDQNFCVINCVIRDKGQQVGWHNPLSRLSSWFYCSTNFDVIFPCCVFVYLFCFVSWSRRHHNTTTQLPRFQFRTVLHEANLVLLLFLFCLLARFLRIQEKPKSAWTLKMYKKVTKHFSAIAKQRCYPFLKTLWQSPVFVLNFIVFPWKIRYKSSAKLYKAEQNYRTRRKYASCI